MQYESQVLRLQTDADYSKRLPLGLCGDLLRHLRPLMAYSVRMAIEGSSVGTGRSPSWLVAVSDIRFVDYAREGDDTLIQLDLPSLGIGAPELYDQAELWPNMPSPLHTAANVLSEAVAEIDMANQDSLRYDRPLLRKLRGVGPVFSEHLHAILLPVQDNGREMQAMSMKTISNAAILVDRTPPPQEVRLVGQLDMIRRSTRSFGLQLDDGSEVHGVLESGDDVEELKQYFGARVLVLGKAIYRPSGALMRVDAHAIERGEGQPGIFSKVPPARSRRLTVKRDAARGQGWASFSSYFGKWPGDETDEQWEEMLVELKK